MRDLFSWQLAILILAGMTAGAHDSSRQSGQSREDEPADNATATSPTNITRGVTVTGSAPRSEPPLPKLPPTEFTDCMKEGENLSSCAYKLDIETHIVLEKCLNRDGHERQNISIQACTESIDANILQGSQRFFLLANRADAYFAEGDRHRALEDYNSAIKMAPHKANLYYNRGVLYAAQGDIAAALKDCDAALNIDNKLVATLHERAKIYQRQSDFVRAVADDSVAICMRPTVAALWSERGFVYLL